MGRYDKIRVYNGSSFVQPSQMYVWNGSAWADCGINDSDNRRSAYGWDGSSWRRFTLNRQVNYGDKEWRCYQDGSNGTFNVNSGANVNQNKFNFTFYVNKDYDGAKPVAQFGNTTQGWKIQWLADGRIQWSTYYGGNGYHSYSSNYIKAYNWTTVSVYSNNTGTGTGTLSWGGTNSTANRSGRHQYRGLTLTLGMWGMWYRGSMRSYGINSGGNYVDMYSNVNNYSVMTGSQTADNVSINNGQVIQDTSVSWV